MSMAETKVRFFEKAILKNCEVSKINKNCLMNAFLAFYSNVATLSFQNFSDLFLKLQTWSEKQVFKI